MNKYPMTIREILKEVKDDHSHSTEDILFFLQECISLLENYDGLADCLIYIIQQLKENREYDKEYLPVVEVLTKLCDDKETVSVMKEQNELVEIQQRFSQIQQEYLTMEDDTSAIGDIGKFAYYLNEPVVHVVASILHSALIKSTVEENIGRQVLKQQNIGFLIEMLSEGKNTFTIICKDNVEVNWDVLANMISRLGHKVIMLTECEKSNKIAGLQDCIDQAEKYEDVTVFPFLRENLMELVGYICKNETQKGMSCIIGTGAVLDELMLEMERGCEVERLSLMKTPVLEDKLTFGWAGSYLEYISKVYKCDAEKDVFSQPEYRFSIVIPTKDSAETLRYTLMTCLNQRWKGKYEVLVSDNSTQGNENVHNLCMELMKRNKNIKYIRTPRTLAIAKSFEYAILKTRGEFIIPIGADDGLLPWSLNVLDEVLDRCKDEVIMWNRGQYQWPDYGAGISDRLTFPCAAVKGKYNIYYKEGLSYIASILQQPLLMYGLPLLYINSGFRRSYMKTLLNKTGRMWDGPCQDIFMGVVNSAINKKIPMVDYPITMAGMAHCSTGAAYTRLLDTLEKVNKKGKNGAVGENSYIGGWCSSPIERLVPRFTSDIGLCYNCLIRVVAKKILPLEMVEQNFNMKKWYVNLYRLMHKEEYIYERQVVEMDYAARQNGNFFYKWFKEDGLWKELVLKKGKKDEEPISDNEKRYSTQVYKDGMVEVDASQYGVKNIFHAALLAEKISEY